MAEIRFIFAGVFIDGTAAAARRNVMLTVENGIITAINPATRPGADDDIPIDDLSCCTILPALVDCSVFLSRSPAVDQRMRSADEESGPAIKAAMVERHIYDCHAHGVRGVADCGDISGLIKDYQGRMAEENIIDIKTSGPLCRDRHWAADSPANNDFIKIAYDDNIEAADARHPRLSHEDLRYILRLRGRKKAVVTANGRQSVKEALEAGCDAIEQGYAMGENNLREMADKGVLWIPNLLRAKNALDSAGSSGDVGCRFSHRYVAPGKRQPGAEAFWQKTLNEQLKQLRFARELGLTTAVGTGAGSIGILHGESMAEEMKLFIKAGYTREETIHCASENGAGFFGMKELGALTVGRQATFLITRGTAQQLPRKLSYLEGIYVDGIPSAIYHKNHEQVPAKPLTGDLHIKEKPSA
ncbi:MAG TPA: amidohydrolase [Desulfobacterales bacterium]|nr:amidohydrolase [Desulfobacterales bacterium]